MPHLVQLDKKYGEKGLVIIGDEVQGSAKADIEKITEKAKVAFPITTGSTRPADLAGIPRALVFDPAGEIVYDGHPGAPDFDRSIKKALKDVDSSATSGSDSRLPAAAKPVIESRNWTNAEGQKISAAVLSIDGDKVRFKLRNGKEVNYPIAKLSEDDQEVIKEAAKAAAEGDEEEEDDDE